MQSLRHGSIIEQKCTSCGVNCASPFFPHQLPFRLNSNSFSTPTLWCANMARWENDDAVAVHQIAPKMSAAMVAKSRDCMQQVQNSSSRNRASDWIWMPFLLAVKQSHRKHPGLWLNRIIISNNNTRLNHVEEFLISAQWWNNKDR